MHDWLKNNQKKLLAVLGAMLMVTFLINVPMSSLTSGSRSRGVAKGKMGKTVLYSEDFREARNEWQALERSVDYAAYRATGQPRSVLDQLGRTITTEVEQHPDLYLLLIKEAEQQGISVSNDLVHEVVQNQMDPARAEDAGYLNAVRHFLMVKALRDELISDSKFSHPMWQRDLAETYDQVTLHTVDFVARTAGPTARPPTTQQVEDLFDKFKHAQPAAIPPLPGDPLGLGYEIPNRVKFQYFVVTAQQADQAARSAHDQYFWDEKSREYYYANPDKYVRPAAASQPATQPTSQASAATQPSAATQLAATTQPATTQASTTQVATTQPAATQTAIAQTATTQPAATQTAASQPAGPTTRPFAEVKDEILKALLQPEADKIQKEVTETLHQRLADDYLVYRLTHPATTNPAATPPSTAPAAAGATTRPAGYASYGYLEQVALDIQKKFNLLPQVHQVAEWQDAAQLAVDPGIGAAELDGTKFAQYATNDVGPFLTSGIDKATALQVWQPSELFSGADHSVYEFRLTDASPAHAPDLADIRPRVTSDAQLSAAYDAANADAIKFAETARKGTLAIAALDNHLPVISIGPFSPLHASPASPIPNFLASPDAIAAVATQARDLLSDATTANPHPIAVIPLPTERKVMVAELSDVTLPDPEAAFYSVRLRTEQGAQAGMSESLSASYFDYKAVCARLNYVPEKSADDSGS